MKLQLIMLPKQPILVSDEKIVDGDKCFADAKFLHNIVEYRKSPCPPPYVSNLSVLKKAVAGIPEMPTIDFSALSEADCKRIGWVDVDKAANEYYNAYDPNSEHTEGLVEGFKRGFKTSQSLNEKKYSEVFDWLEKNDYLSDKRSIMEKEFIQYISQPKSFDVEVEMEEKTTEDIQRELGIYGHDEGLNEAEYKDFAAQNSLIKPKITNGAIRILRVL